MIILSCSKNANEAFLEDVVYICNGHYSKSYHYDSKCEGLRSCTTEVFETTIESAKKKGRTLCGYEQN